MSAQTSLELRSVSEFTLSEIIALLNRGFANYLVKVTFSEAILLQMIRQDSVDLVSSRVVVRADKAVGVALIARRGWSSRLAAMAVVPEAQGRGIGQWLMGQLLTEAQKRGDRAMVLEVIEQNTAAVRLYQGSGFRLQRRLLSYTTAELPGEPAEGLTETDIREVARWVTAYGLPDLPWQMSGETLAQKGPPHKAYRLGSAWAAISNPQRPQIALFAVIVPPEARLRGEASRLLRALAAQYPGKSWGILGLCPEELAPFLEKLGFKQEPLTQFQMIKELK